MTDKIHKGVVGELAPAQAELVTVESPTRGAKPDLPPMLAGTETRAVSLKVQSFYSSVHAAFEAWVSRRKSKNTQDAYRTDVLKFVEWLGLKWPEGASELLRVSVAEVQAYRDELEELGSRLPVLQGHISNLSQEIESAQGRIEAYQSLMQDKAAIEVGLAKLLQFRLRYEELSSSRDRFDELMKGKADLERHIDSARGGLEERIKELDRRMRVELRPKVNASSALSEKIEDESDRSQKLGDD